MTEATKRYIPEINAVDGFSPAEFTRELPSDDGTTSLYMDVKFRLLWFRLHRPNGKVEPELVSVDDKSAVVCCKIFNDRSDASDQFVAKSYAQRFRSDEKFGDRFLEVAETAAVGRALASAGYGTQFCGAQDMLSGDMVDSPVDLPDQEDESPLTGVSNLVHHEVTPAPAPNPVTPPQKQPVQPAPLAPTPAPNPQAPKLETLDDYLNSMTLDDAKKVKVDVGYNSGRTLGDLVMHKPSDLEWYVKHYSGRNLALKAGAILLLNAVTQKAS